jgi:hypothetical protein
MQMKIWESLQEFTYCGQLCLKLELNAAILKINIDIFSQNP